MISAAASYLRIDSTAAIPAAPLPIITKRRILHIPVRDEHGLKEIAAFEAQHAARAAGYTLSTSQAVALAD
jgi:hypothetical protein